MRILVLLFGLALGLSSPAVAAPIVAGSTALPTTAIQDITLLPGTPLNPTGSPILLAGLSGSGVLTLNRATQTGTSIAIPSFAGGQYYGSYPGLGDYVFGNVGTLTGADFSGTIANVVQNPTDPGFATGQPSSFQSGDFSFGGNSFGFTFLSGPLTGVTLYTDPAVPFQFSASFNGLPPSAGTTLVNSGPDVLFVTFNGLPVATSSNRRIVVTPEPASLAVVAVLGVGGLMTARRRIARDSSMAS